MTVTPTLLPVLTNCFPTEIVPSFFPEIINRIVDCYSLRCVFCYSVHSFGYPLFNFSLLFLRNELVDRSFDLAEIHIMLDAIQAASFITDKKTDLLVDKLANLAGSRKGEVLKRNIVAFNKTKNTNESIFYSVDEIVRAISKKKKIEFKYFDYDAKHKKLYRKEGGRYVMNPYSTVFSDDNYYLLAYNDKYKTIMHYRVDRMDSVKMLDDDIVSEPKSTESVSLQFSQLKSAYISKSPRLP